MRVSGAVVVSSDCIFAVGDLEVQPKRLGLSPGSHQLICGATVPKQRRGHRVQSGDEERRRGCEDLLPRAKAIHFLAGAFAQLGGTTLEGHLDRQTSGSVVAECERVVLDRSTRDDVFVIDQSSQ